MTPNIIDAIFQNNALNIIIANMLNTINKPVKKHFKISIISLIPITFICYSFVKYYFTAMITKSFFFQSF